MYNNTLEKIVEAQNGNQEVMQNLIDKNNGLIWSIVKRFKDRGHELEDLYQIGTMGFIKAVKRFDAGYDVKLSTYAVPYIVGEIKRFIRDDGPIKISRSTKELVVRIREMQKQYNEKLGREITINELAKELQVPKEDIVYALTSARPLESIDEEIYDETSKTTLIDKISTNKDEANAIINNLTLKKLIEDLQPREKEIIMLRYYKEHTQTQVAKILGITQVQVSRIEKRILQNMRRKMLS